MSVLVRLLIVFVLLAWSVDAGETVQEIFGFAGPKLCGPNGQLEVTVIQHKGNMATDRIKGVGMRRNGTYYSIVPGSWYDEDYRPITVFRRGEPAIFVSDEAVFSPGSYHVVLANMNISTKATRQIDYYTGENYLDDGSSLAFDVTCPQTRHTCGSLNLTLSCNNTRQGLIVIFGGIGALDPKDDVLIMPDYRIVGDDERYLPLPADARYTKPAPQTFVLLLPDVSNIPWVKAAVVGCNPRLFKASLLRRCAPQQTADGGRNTSASGNATPAVEASASALPPEEDLEPEAPTVDSDDAPQAQAVPALTPDEALPNQPFYRRLFGWIRSLF